METLRGSETKSAKKRVWVQGGPYAGLAAALARLLGHEVTTVREGPIDLEVVEADRPATLPPPALAPRPLMAVAPRRLRYGEAEALRSAGARFVVDAEASLLDIAFALSELLFPTISEQRRYWHHTGGIDVLYWRLGAMAEPQPAVGKLVGLAREGGCLCLESPLPDGTPIEIAIDLPSGPARIRGRVAFSAVDRCGVEFALDDQHVAPRLSTLVAQARRVSWSPPPPPARSPSEVTAD